MPMLPHVAFKWDCAGKAQYSTTVTLLRVTGVEEARTLNRAAATSLLLHVPQQPNAT